MKLRKGLRIITAVIVLLSIAGLILGYLNLLSAALLASFSVTIWIGEYFLFERNYIPEVSNFHLDMQIVRELAATEKNQLPIRLNSVIVAEGEIPDWIVVAGGAPHNFPISFASFQVVYNGKTGIIECPFNKALYDKFSRFQLLGIKGKAFYQEKYDSMQKAMLEADFIIATHEHWDHVGGIAQSSHLEELMKKTVLTPEQLRGHTINMAGFPQGAFDDYIPLKYDQYHVLAPGVVLIKAPGHSVGSQMIYVKLQDGKEFLLIGDVGWNMVNIEKLANHSRIGMLFRYENGKQLGHQLRWLFDNIYQDPIEKLHILTSHDLEQLQNYRRTGIIGDKFEFNFE
ncbi:MAG: hypothetical protein ACFFGZ_16415 [Candidatus Thorarchaeota archaeon]